MLAPFGSLSCYTPVSSVTADVRRTDLKISSNAMRSVAALVFAVLALVVSAYNTVPVQAPARPVAATPRVAVSPVAATNFYDPGLDNPEVRARAPLFPPAPDPSWCVCARVSLYPCTELLLPTPTPSRSDPRRLRSAASKKVRLVLRMSRRHPLPRGRHLK